MKADQERKEAKDVEKEKINEGKDNGKFYLFIYFDTTC